MQPETGALVRAVIEMVRADLHYQVAPDGDPDAAVLGKEVEAAAKAAAADPAKATYTLLTLSALAAWIALDLTPEGGDPETVLDKFGARSMGAP